MKQDDKADVVFLLGAGASIPCNVPGMKGLMSQFESQVTDKEAQGLIRILKQPPTVGLEEFIERVHTLANLNRRNKVIFYQLICAGEKTRENLEIISSLEESLMNFIWVKCLNFNRTRAEQTYLPLLDLRKTHNWNQMHIFSLNYDTCVEETCIRNGIEYNCGLKKEKKDEKTEIYLYKLHGSVSWFKDPSDQQIKEIFWDPHFELRFDDKGDPPKRTYPLMIYPVIGINELILDPFLGYMNSFKKELLSAKFCISIGYSFADRHVKELLEMVAAENKKFILIMISPHATSLAESIFLDSELKVFPYDGNMEDIQEIIDVLFSRKNLNRLKKAFSYITKSNREIDIEKRSKYLRNAVLTFNAIGNQYNLIKYGTKCIAKCEKTISARVLGEICLILGDLFEKRHRIDLSDYFRFMAKKFYTQSLEQYGGKKSIMFILSLVEALKRCGYSDKAIDYLIMATDISEKENKIKKISEIKIELNNIRDTKNKENSIRNEFENSKNKLKSRFKIGYLFQIRNFNICYEIFKFELTEYSRGLYVTQHFPDALEERYGFDNAECIWLGSNSLFEVPKIDVNDILRKVEEHLRSKENSILYIDCLKYIFDNCENDQEAWIFFHALMELARVHESIIMLLTNPDDFNLRETRIMSQNLEVISENDTNDIFSS